MSDKAANEYPLRAYGTMIGDRWRVEAYRAALERVIKPDSIVLDIGAGSGILSMLACQLGARKVYAVEPGDVLALAVELARDNGFADRIEFFSGTSFELTLQHPVDVIVYDLHGVLPLHRNLVETIADARRRLLAPGGRLIPGEETIYMQPIADEELYAETLHVWGPDVHGLNLSAGRRLALSQTRKVDVARSQRLGQPAALIRLDYYRVETPRAEGVAEWTAAEPTTAHGVALWFDSTFIDGVTLSNAPEQPRKVYGQLFLPFLEPLALTARQRVRVRVEALPIKGDYLWRWTTLVMDPAGGVVRTLQQSTFEAEPVDPRRLRQAKS